MPATRGSKWGRAWACLWFLAGAGTLIAAQARQAPTFRAGVQLVRIDVSVLDDKRQPVRGLQVSDFTVLEDGQPRPIRSFQAVDVATAPTRPMPVPPDSLEQARQIAAESARDNLDPDSRW